MKKITFSVKEFKNRADLSSGEARAYSLMKYGSKTQSREIGKEMGEKFFYWIKKHEALNQLKKDKICILSAPYLFAPVAGTALKDYFLSAFNYRWVLNAGGQSLIDLKCSRTQSYIGDYGSMSEVERDAVITAEQFDIDAAFIRDKTLIFIDDVRITGSHERRIEAMLEKANFQGTVIFLYYLNLVGNDETPDVEAFLNMNAIDNLNVIRRIAESRDGIILNTRSIKYILQQDHDDFVVFILSVSDHFAETLLTYAVGNNYHLEPSFEQNFKYLVSMMADDINSEEEEEEEEVDDYDDDDFDDDDF